MARKRNRKGQFVKRARRHHSNPRKRRSPAVAAAPATKRRRRRSGKKARRQYSISVARPRRVTLSNPRRRRRYHGNPSIKGIVGGIFSGPTVKRVLWTVGGMAGTPFIEGFVTQYLPDSMKTSDTTGKIVRYGIRIASAVGLGFAVKQFAGKEAGRDVMIGGFAYLGLQAVKDLGLLKTETSPGVGRYFSPRLGSQPLLGSYPSLGSRITTNVPSRIRPQNRY